MPEMSSVFSNMLRLARRMVHVHLRRLFSAAVGWLSTSGLICSLSPMILYRLSIRLFYCWEYGIDVHITIVRLSIFPLISVNRCLIYWSAPSLGLQKFTVFYFLDELFVVMEWPPLSLVTCFGLQSILSEMTTVTPVFFSISLDCLFHPCSLRLCVTSENWFFCIT